MPRHVDCKCGHDWKSHVEAAFAPQCIAPRCTCLRCIPVTAPPRFRPKPTAPELVRDPKMSDTAEAVNGLPQPAPPVTPLREPLSRPPLAAAPPVPEPEISPPAAQGPTADELPKANEGLDRRGRHINRTPANCPDCAKRSGTSASASSSLTSWASRTGPRDGPTSGGSYAGRPVSHPVTLHSCSALVGDRDA